MFEIWEEAQYRSASLEELELRWSAIADELESAESGLTAEQLDAEVRACDAAIKRREQVAQMRSRNIAAVSGGAGSVVATTRAAQVSLPNPADRYDTDEYRRAFMDHVCGRAAMPMSMRAAVTVDGTYTSEQDYANTHEHKVMVPQTMGREIVRKLREYGHIWPKVRKMSVKGGLWFRIWDLQLEATWINDKQVSEYQTSDDADMITFSYFELESRFAQTLLAAAVTWDEFQSQFVELVTESMVRAIEKSIVRGTGVNQPLGIVNDDRVKTLGKVIEVTEADVDNWVFWRKLPYKLERLYRNRGEWLFSDTTYGCHIDTLRDDIDRPLGKYDPLNDNEPLKLLGRPVELIEPDVLPGFDEAEVGDVFGIYGDWRNYIVNTQPGMPMNVVQWTDHESNQEKIKCLTALDGKVLDPYGWALLVKAEADETPGA